MGTLQVRKKRELYTDIDRSIKKMISSIILFKDIKLFGQRDSYYELQGLAIWDGGVKKRYIHIKMFGFIDTHFMDP